MRDFALDLRIPPLTTGSQLRSLSVSTLLIAAGQDVSFPGTKMIARARKFVPNLEVELMAESRHSPPTTDEFRRWLANRVTRFLQTAL